MNTPLHNPAPAASNAAHTTQPHSMDTQGFEMSKSLTLAELSGFCDEILSEIYAKISDQTPNYVLLLRGEIGAGKTSFVKALLERDFQNAQNATAQNAQNVTSPTFSIAQSYESVSFGELHHYDLYRKSLEEMLVLGLLDMLSLKGLHLIEWGDTRLENMLRAHGFKVGSIEITTKQDFRLYKVAL